MTNKLRFFKQLLDLINAGFVNTKELQNKVQSSETLNSLVELEKLGLIGRDKSKLHSQISQTSWEITDRGSFFIQIFDSLIGDDFSVVMTIPPKFFPEFEKRFTYVKFTEKVFKEIVNDAKSEIKIFSPYIDASFISILEKVSSNVSIKIVTIPVKYGHGQNPLLERLKTRQNIIVKYLNEEENGTQIFQLHAKIFIVDNDKLYIGSANLKETSLFYNLESGIIIQNENIIEKYTKIFDYFYGIAR